MGGVSKLSAAVIAGIVLVAGLPLLFLIPALTDSPPPPQPVTDTSSRSKKSTSVSPVTGTPEIAVPPVEAAPVEAPAAVAAVPPAVVAPVPVPVVVPNPGAPDVMALEQRLSSLGYLVGKVDGRLDGATRYGITAFQKVEGLSRTGVADGATLSRLQTAVTPEPRFTTPPDHIEVDIPRQVVFMVRGGKVTAIVPTSTGTNEPFTSQGRTRRAVTPNGQFQIFFKRNGWRVSPLGRLYRPAYFNGGIALHGSNSVPISPASHGCVRLPMVFADWFLDNAPVGQVVYVYGGPAGDNPQPLLDEPPVGIGDQGRLPASAPVADIAPPPPPAPPVGPAPNPVSGLLGNLLSPG